MSILHVRNVPEEMYDRIQRLAASQNRSLSAQVVTLLERGLQTEELRLAQGKLLKAIRRRRFSPPPGAPDAVALLREDRER